MGKVTLLERKAVIVESSAKLIGVESDFKSFTPAPVGVIVRLQAESTVQSSACLALDATAVLAVLAE